MIRYSISAVHITVADRSAKGYYEMPTLAFFASV